MDWAELDSSRLMGCRPCSGSPPDNCLNRPGTKPSPTGNQPGFAGLVPGLFRTGSGLVPGLFRQGPGQLQCFASSPDVFDDQFSDPIGHLGCFDEAGGEAVDGVNNFFAGLVKTAETPDRVRERVIKTSQA